MFNVHIYHISDAVLHEGNVVSVRLPGVIGEFEVSDHHMPVVSLLASGEIRIEISRDLAGEAGFYPSKSVRIQQGVVRYDGKELFAVVE